MGYTYRVEHDPEVSDLYPITINGLPHTLAEAVALMHSLADATGHTVVNVKDDMVDEPGS